MYARTPAPLERSLRLLPVLNGQAHAHLVANMLSLAAALSRRRPELAEDLLTCVAGYLRGHLVPGPPFASLSDELRATLALIGIERARLGGRLRLEVACSPEALAAQVPAMVLQPLVENAIRHGISRRAHGGRIRISARVSGEYLNLAVTDNGPGVRRAGRRDTASWRVIPRHPAAPGAEGVGSSSGWGLVGLRLRLEGFCGLSARLRLLSREGAGTLASVTLPLLGRP